MKWFLASVVGGTAASALSLPTGISAIPPPVGPMVPSTLIKVPRGVAVPSTTTTSTSAQAASTTSTTAAAPSSTTTTTAAAAVSTTTTGVATGMTTTTTAVAATTTTATPNVFDKFLVKNLKATKHGHNHDITFMVDDLSTAPVEMAKCHIHWNGPHVRRGPVKCDDGWFTASVMYWDDPQSFGLQINHAFGETCIGCNNEQDEDYNGDVGSCTLALDEDRMTDLKGHEDHWESSATRDLNCFADFDD